MATRPRSVGVLLAALLAAGSIGCVTVAEHRKLERRVIDLQRDRQPGQAREHLADLSAEIDDLKAALRSQGGQLEQLEQIVHEALVEARKARREAAAAMIGNGAGVEAPAPRTGAGAAVGAGLAAERAGAGEELSDELKAYQAGLAAWRANDYSSCIDRFRSFLQTYASSSRADDAAFWIADCHYKQGEFKNAVLRFDDVVRNYPTGDKAPDALYRQGESLLKLGPNYHEAARRAFERVLKEYPESERAAQAHQQLEVRGAG